MAEVASRAILLDIEGTVAPISFVYDVLFPFARAQLGSFLLNHWNDPAVIAARAQMIRDALPAIKGDTIDEIQSHAIYLMECDAKATGLKQLQGLIWDEGYRQGKLRSKLFADVPTALRRWRDSGKRLAIFSSGSVAAQKAFFSHTEFGDLTPYLSAYFDTKIGPKRSGSSYRAIAASLSLPPEEVLFLSDIPEEIAAARQAGMCGKVVVRPGNAPVSLPPDDHPLTTFDELQ